MVKTGGVFLCHSILDCPKSRSVVLFGFLCFVVLPDFSPGGVPTNHVKVQYVASTDRAHVCLYRYIFEDQISSMKADKPIKYAYPGDERQDSVRNGFQAIEEDAALVAIHDSARPLLQEDDFR